ncbi:MAG: glycosyl hydrolase [Acidobacteria bacterium]|nr:MAG: glycosyl hydrolase [Acidobacteriota bacterium]
MLALTAGTLALAPAAAGDDGEDGAPVLDAELVRGLELRAIGPALQSGRIADVALDEHNPGTWYVAVASGGVWKTTNAGTTWTPIFDRYGSYSIGCVTVDPTNPNVVWVGTGENNSQRSVGWGDGVYKSLDGGESFVRVGLERSEHVGKIVIDPRDPDVVYVAAQGPLWSDGGDRGLYKTTDGGAGWQRVLAISERTGVTDVVLDPRDPDVVYAAAFQRRRRVWALVAGGPESAIYKSVDGGASWKKLSRGLPGGPVGRIGLAVSPQNPDVVYATIAATREESGFYRSANRGESWVKMSDWVAIDPQYYQELFPDPWHFDRLYAMDVLLQVTDDGGKSFRPLNSRFKHVDNHALAFDPADKDYLLSGTDGGLYESWDRGETWRFVANLPVTQFYRVGVDDARPFYNVYGGTQDNDSIGVPSRTTNVHGIRSSDVFHTSFGDGYQTRVDPENPNIVYSMWQYGELVRYDRESGEMLNVQPQPAPGDPPLVWNWDSPLIISPHDGKRLYFGANRLFRSDDRGASWTAISGDLTRGLDRNRLPVMGRTWSVDAVWKNVFTSKYGNATALDESPLIPGLLYAGTDDGLVHASDDGGDGWRRIERFPGVPERTYVSDLVASRHLEDRLYALFNNHKSGDFTPYVLVSDDRGRSWRSLRGDLPEGHAVWSLVEDHVDPQLLFLGTEFGLFFSRDGGARWIELEGGVPTVAFRDLEIQRRAGDLVAGSFGRGIFILDDYSPLRLLTPELLAREGALLPVADAWAYIPQRPLGWREKGVQGDAFFTAPNPPFGAVFTYYLRQELRSRRARRLAAEAAARARGDDVFYPDWEALRAEDRELPPAVVLTITGDGGEVVARLRGPVTKGLHRVAWNLRLPSPAPPAFDAADPAAGYDEPSGPLALPGTYRVQLATLVDGVLAPLDEPRSFAVVPLVRGALPPADRPALHAFERRVWRLQRAVLGAFGVIEETAARLAHARRALHATAGADPGLLDELRILEAKLADVRQAFTGDETVARRREPTLPGILARLDRLAATFWTSTADPTPTHRRNYEAAATVFAAALADLRQLVEDDLVRIETALEAAGAPWTPGRPLPEWRPD